MYNVDVDIDTALAGVWHFWLHYHRGRTPVQPYHGDAETGDEESLCQGAKR